MDFRHELLLVLNYGDPYALRRLIQMRFPDEAQPYAQMPDDAFEEAFHRVRCDIAGGRPELADESRAWLDARGKTAGVSAQGSDERTGPPTPGTRRT